MGWAQNIQAVLDLWQALGHFLKQLISKPSESPIKSTGSTEGWWRTVSQIRDALALSPQRKTEVELKSKKLNLDFSQTINVRWSIFIVHFAKYCCLTLFNSLKLLKPKSMKWYSLENSEKIEGCPTCGTTLGMTSFENWWPPFSPKKYYVNFPKKAWGKTIFFQIIKNVRS